MSFLRKITLLTLLTFLSVVGMYGCTEVDTNGGKVDVSIAVDGTEAFDAVADVALDLGPVDTYVPEPGEFGWPCGNNEDCYSGWCVLTPEGNICTKPCEDACPANYECRPLITEGDPVYLCLPKWLHLCDPCQTTSDCAGNDSDTGHYCLDHGPKGRFCGGDCSGDGTCPSGYDCKNVPVGGGLVHPQCVPTSGTCTCSKLAIQAQLTTQCVISNEAGTCVGSRMCEVSGLNSCDAKEPGDELCNGLDDDCDGATDNMPANYTCFKTNEHGTCTGQGTCIGGVELCDSGDASTEVCDGVDNNCDLVTDEGFINTDGDEKADCVDDDDDNDGVPDVADNCPVNANTDQVNTDGDGQGDECDDDDDNDSKPDSEDCAPLDPTIHQGALEQCDGIDNDCNGIIDDNLCDDGNLCTDDSCNADGSCANAPNNQALCDDGSICSQTDKCINGECQGLNPIVCDDGNACTDDSCDAVVGCVTSFNTSPCQDKLAGGNSNECTEGDTCSNGVCTSGPLKNCDDGNACTFDQCDPKIMGGCVHQGTNEGLACDNPNQGQCQASKCQNKICTPYNIDGIGCNTGSGDCPQGSCSGGQCYSSPSVCEYDGGICGSDVPGTCTAAGKCVPTQQSGCQCSSPCSGVCVCCCIPILGCIDLCYAF